MPKPFFLIDDGRPFEVEARVEGKQVTLSPQTVSTALGWELRREGLCHGDRCIPVGKHSDQVNSHGIDLATLADLLSRPVAIDADERAAWLGVSAADRSAPLAALEAPDFELPDLGGKLHRLSGFRGRKVLFIAYASW